MYVCIGIFSTKKKNTAQQSESACREVNRQLNVKNKNILHRIEEKSRPGRH